MAAEPAARSEALAAAARASGTPGAVLGIRHRGATTVLPYGVLSTRTGVSTTADSVFQIGSITKTWTATMAAQLVAAGRLALDTTVADVLPGIRLGAEDRAAQITVQHLLTHTSGLDGDVFTDTGRGDDCLERYVDLLATSTAVHEPGAAYSYCNSGFVLLGRIIEVLDDRGWDAALRARIVEPLGLPDVCTLPEEALLRRAAVGHDEHGPVPAWGLPRALGPAGLVTTTAADLLGYAGQWLGPEVPGVLAQMTEPRFEVPSGDGFDRVGLAWRIGDWGGHRVIGHSGDTFGQSAQLRVVPALDLAVTVLTNGTHADAVLQGVLPGLVHDLTGVEVPPPPGPGTGAAPTDVGRHRGTYLRRAMRYEVREDDAGLHVLLTPVGELADRGAPEHVRLVPRDDSGDRFVARAADTDPWASLAFAALPDGGAYLLSGGRIALRVEP